MGSHVSAMDALGVKSNESTDSVIKSEKNYYVLITVRDKGKDRSELTQNGIVGGRDGIRTRNPLLAKRGTKFAKTCRSRRNPLNSDNL